MNGIKELKKYTEFISTLNYRNGDRSYMQKLYKKTSHIKLQINTAN